MHEAIKFFQDRPAAAAAQAPGAGGADEAVRKRREELAGGLLDLAKWPGKDGSDDHGRGAGGGKNPNVHGRRDAKATREAGQRIIDRIKAANDAARAGTVGHVESTQRHAMEQHEAPKDATTKGPDHGAEHSGAKVSTAAEHDLAARAHEGAAAQSINDDIRGLHEGAAGAHQHAANLIRGHAEPSSISRAKDKAKAATDAAWAYRYPVR